MAEDAQLPFDTSDGGGPRRIAGVTGVVTVLPGLSRRDVQPELWAGVAAWRGLRPSERRDRWQDLAAWVDWLIDAYRLPLQPWRSWWTCPGACEELSAMRDWHSELVDVEVANLGDKRAGEDGTAALIDWHRREQSLRRDLARSRVDWHDALSRVISRLLGANAEQKPMLLHEAEMTARSHDLRDTEACDRQRAFDAWLTERMAP